MTITRDIAFNFLDRDDQPRVVVTMAWTQDDPFAVSLTFNTPKRPVWVMAHELLVDGMAGPSGLGDVTVGPRAVDREQIELNLSSPDGRARFSIPRDALAEFLAASAVPELDWWLREVTTSCD
jgi:hypothetical protein